MSTRHDWSIHFIAQDGQRRVGPWLLLDSREKAIAVLDRGRMCSAARQEAMDDLQSWGRTSVHICLDDQQYAALFRIGVSDPRNGYEISLQRAQDRQV